MPPFITEKSASFVMPSVTHYEVGCVEVATSSVTIDDGYTVVFADFQRECTLPFILDA